MSSVMLRLKTLCAKPVAWMDARGGVLQWALGSVLVIGALAGVTYYLIERNYASLVLEPPLVAQSAPAQTRHLVVTYRDTPPDMVVYPSGELDGPLRQVIEEAVRRVNEHSSQQYTVEWKAGSFAEGVDDIENKKGNVDIVTNAHFWTKERAQRMRFSISLGRVPSTINFLVRIDNAMPIKSVNDLKGRKVGYRSSVYYFPEFDDLAQIKGGQFPPFLAFSSDKDIVRAFVQRAIDVIAVDNKHGIERALSAGGVNASNYEYAEYVHKEDADLFLLYSCEPNLQPVFDQLDAEMVKMEKSGLINDIYQSFDADAPRVEEYTGPARLNCTDGKPAAAPLTMMGAHAGR